MFLGAAPSTSTTMQVRLLISGIFTPEGGCVCSFSSKLSKIKQILPHEDQIRLLDTLTKVLHGLPDILRPRMQLAGLADTTNLARSTFHRQLANRNSTCRSRRLLRRLMFQSIFDRHAMLL